MAQTDRSDPLSLRRSDLDQMPLVPLDDTEPDGVQRARVEAAAELWTAAQRCEREQRRPDQVAVDLPAARVAARRAVAQQDERYRAERRDVQRDADQLARVPLAAEQRGPRYDSATTTLPGIAPVTVRRLVAPPGHPDHTKPPWITTRPVHVCGGLEVPDASPSLDTVLRFLGLPHDPGTGGPARTQGASPTTTKETSR